MVREMYASLLKDGAQPRLVGQKLGRVSTLDDCPLDVEVTLQATPAVMYDGVIVPAGEAAALALSRDGRAIEFVRDQYRHDKPMLALGGGAVLFTAAALPTTLPGGGADPGVIEAPAPDFAAALAQFKAVLARHKVYERETDPPRV
jgi:catalase